MRTIIVEKDILTQKIKFKKKYSNRELLLHHYFKKKTKTFPTNVIVLNDYIFYFVKNEDYFRAKMHQNSLRKESINKKIIIVSSEKNLVKQLFSFFPDTYIHDVCIEQDQRDNNITLVIGFLFFEDRGIAVGIRGEYIKAVNEIFKNHIFLENRGFQKTWVIKIQCDLVSL